ncbi:MAG TPA: CoA transferase, partial [Pseudolysinimonas sp.]|nr:CoA transferase [Pseudolysinimonas sp.]
GWSLPSPWDAIAGDYATVDGWVRLHTNAPHHRAAALRVLGGEGQREHIAAAVSSWTAREIESAVVAEGGCAAELRSPAAWAVHEQGLAVGREPLVAREVPGSAGDSGAASVDTQWRPEVSRPLAGLRVLDLTRVLSGPVATRLLAGLGADVLRIDPLDWDEPAVVPEMTLGKRTARLDARDPAGHDQLLALLAHADVIVHGYRADALERLGLGDDVRSAARPGLVDVSLDAYGHTGPWHTRRGFDSLVQMSSGIAAAGILAGLSDRPTPLPVQALDHATGYLAAAAVLQGLAARVRAGVGSRSRLSLARTAVELEHAAALDRVASPETQRDSPRGTELVTPWGAATLLPPPFSLAGVTVRWDRAPRPLGSDAPVW